MIFGIGLIVIGVLGGLGVYFGLLAPVVQTPQVTDATGRKAAGIICILAAVALIIAGILKLAGVW
jgi:phage shock protein PspC (stress-responsive transcriptional regulator)